MFELDGLIYDLIFDREITDDHYISPGGYEIKIAGQKIPLDFTCYSGTIDKKEPCKLHVEHKGLDIAAFPDAGKIKATDDLTTMMFTEFFVFTGEDDEPEINPVRVENLVLDFCEMAVPAEPQLLESASESLTS